MKRRHHSGQSGSSDALHATDGHPNAKQEMQFSEAEKPKEKQEPMSKKEPKNMDDRLNESEKKEREHPENLTENEKPAEALEESETPALSVEQLEEKLRMSEEYNLRLRAEFANYKKRVERDQLEFVANIKADIFRNILPILDDFRVMLEKSQKGESEEGLIEGARMIYQKFLQTLEREGVQKLEALGQEFDPNLHEAMMMQPTTNPEENGRVIEVFQDGFVINDRLIRPAKVVVGRYEPESD